MPSPNIRTTRPAQSGHSAGHPAGDTARDAARERERQLLERARGGDQRAFGELVQASYEHLWAVCLRVTGHRQDAEDALQNALAAAWRNLDRFDGRSRFSTWAHRIASNAAIDVVRARKQTDDIDGEDTPEVADGAVGHDEVIAERSAVGQALAALAPEFREAIVLREYAQMTYQAIADHQGVPIQTVKSRISRARSKLKAELAPLL